MKNRKLLFHSRPGILCLDYNFDYIFEHWAWSLYLLRCMILGKVLSSTVPMSVLYNIQIAHTWYYHQSQWSDGCRMFNTMPGTHQAFHKWYPLFLWMWNSTHTERGCWSEGRGLGARERGKAWFDSSGFWFVTDFSKLQLALALHLCSWETGIDNCFWVLKWKALWILSCGSRCVHRRGNWDNFFLF